MTSLYIPSIEVETASGIREVTLKTRHLMQRRIFMTGVIGTESALDIVSQLMYLEDESDEPVHFYINSPGGSVNDGMLIYDVLESMKVPVHRYCIGMAASMGAVILSGGKKGNRFILPHSEVMIHEPLLNGDVGGSASSIKRKAESILETRSVLNGILAKNTGKTVEEIDAATAYDNYMNAEESVAFGLCDAVVERIF